MEEVKTASSDSMTMSEEERKLGNAPISKLLVAYAVPSIISLVVSALYNIVDQIFIGNGVGMLGNGATNVIHPFNVIAISIAMFFGNGGAAFLSLRLGEKRYDEAQKGIGTTISVTAITSVVFIVLAAVLFRPICMLFGCTPSIWPYAVDYGLIILIGLPFMSVSTVINSFIRADGSPRYSMVSLLIGAILNTILDPIFIFVFHWGVTGAAAATVIGQFVGFIVSVLYLPKFKTAKPARRDFRPKWSVLKNVCSLGVSSFISQIAMLLLIGILNNVYVKYGALSKYGSDIPLTALGISSKISQIVQAFVFGTAVGSQPIIGYNYGARNFDRVKKTFLSAITICTVMMVFFTIIFQIFPGAVVRLFGNESDLYNEFAEKCLRRFMLVIVFNGFQTSAFIFFQAIGKPKQSAILSMLRQIVFLIPSIFITSSLFGIEGTLWSTPIADTLAFVASLICLTVQWKKIFAAPEERLPESGM